MRLQNMQIIFSRVELSKKYTIAKKKPAAGENFFDFRIAKLLFSRSLIPIIRDQKYHVQ